MAFHRDSTQSAEMIGATSEVVEAADTKPLRPASGEWRSDDDAALGELLQGHGFGEALVARLVELAAAPNHVKRPVDRLAIALGAQFNFFALEDTFRAPIMLCGLPGAGTSTLAAKLVARFDASEVLVISAGVHAAAQTAELAEQLEALDLPLTCAADAEALRRAAAGAEGRKIVIDAGSDSPLDTARLQEFAAAAGAAGILVLSAETAAAEAAAAAHAAAGIGIGRIIVTHLDVARCLGAALTAADAAKLALVGASITPHFGFGMRTLTPENLARRLTAVSIQTALS